MSRYVHIQSTADVAMARECQRLVHYTAGSKIDDLVASMGGWDELPDQFVISGEAWDKAEAEISEQVNLGHWWRVIELGDAYVARVQSFCQRWAQQYNGRTVNGTL